MNILKFHLLRVLLLCAGTGFLAMGCSNDDDDSPRELASKTTLTLSKYYNDKGAMTLPTWNRSDKAGLFVTDQSAPEAAFQRPRGKTAASTPKKRNLPPLNGAAQAASPWSARA